MAKIDFEPNTAPLSGAITPTIDDISRLTESTDRIVWRSPTTVAADGALAKPLLLPPIIGVVLLIGWAVLNGVTHSPSAAPRVPVGVLAEPPFDSASSVYAVLKSPSAADYSKLNKAVDSGVAVTLVCPAATANPAGSEPAKFQQFAADETLIVSEGFLLDGFRWFPVDKTRATRH